MWVVFNKKGQLIEKLEGSSVPRVGDTSFEIVCVFSDIEDVSASYPNATITLQKPNIEPETYPTMLMEYSASRIYSGNDGVYLKNGSSYKAFYFQFGDIKYEEDTVILLDTAGTWKAFVKLLNPNSSIFVQGTVSFDVEGSSLSSETEVPIITILDNIYTSMATKLNLTGGQLTGSLYMGWDNPVVFGDPNDSYVGPSVYSDSAKEGILYAKAASGISLSVNGKAYTVPTDETSGSVLATRYWVGDNFYTKTESDATSTALSSRVSALEKFEEETLPGTYATKSYISSCFLNEQSVLNLCTVLGITGTKGSDGIWTFTKNS